MNRRTLLAMLTGAVAVGAAPVVAEVVPVNRTQVEAGVTAIQQSQWTPDDGFRAMLEKQMAETTSLIALMQSRVQIKVNVGELRTALLRKQMRNGSLWTSK